MEKKTREKERILRQKIEEKRRLLDQNIHGRESLLKQNGLSQELDHLIEEYIELTMCG